MPVSRAFLYTSFRVPSTGAAPNPHPHFQVPITELPQRNDLLLEPLRLSLKFPRKGAPFNARKRVSFEARCPPPEPLLLIFQGPSKGVRSPESPHRASSERDAPLLEPLYPSLKVPGK